MDNQSALELIPRSNVRPQWLSRDAIPRLQGCFGDAHVEAKQARALEPFGKGGQVSLPQADGASHQGHAISSK